MYLLLQPFCAYFSPLTLQFLLVGVLRDAGYPSYRLGLHPRPRVIVLIFYSNFEL